MAYLHGLTLSPTSRAYNGLAFSPSNNRAYFSPESQAGQTNWHYLDCTTGSTVTYIHTLTYGGNSQTSSGGVFSPVQNRVYLVPFGHMKAHWYYIDCTNAHVGVYFHSLASPNGARGAVYSPVQNRIYFNLEVVPANRNFHFIDLDTGKVRVTASETELQSQSESQSKGRNRSQRANEPENQRQITRELEPELQRQSYRASKS